MKEVETLLDGRMDTRASAVYLGLRKKTLAQWRWRGTGPRYVKRGRIYYFKDDLDEWLRSGLTEPEHFSERGKCDEAL